MLVNKVYSLTICAKRHKSRIHPRVKVEYGKVLRILRMVLRLLVQEKIKDSIPGTTYTMKSKFLTA